MNVGEMSRKAAGVGLSKLSFLLRVKAKGT